MPAAAPDRSAHPIAACAAVALAGLSALPAPAQADPAVAGGRPRIAVEFEFERAPGGRESGLSATVIPGLQWQDAWVDRAEILLQAEREREREDGLTRYENERKLGLRLRKNFRLDAAWRGYLRGLVGRAFGPDEAYDYAYAETALIRRFEHADWMVGYRFVRAIDGSEGHDTDKLRLGPSFDLDERRELEFRWVRTWDARTRDHESDSLIVEFAYKF